MHHLFFIIFIGLSSLSILNATTITWDGGTDDDWGKAANWQENRLPMMEDTVIISGSLSGQSQPVVNFDSSPGSNIYALRLLDGATLNVKSGTLSLVPGASQDEVRIIIENSILANAGIINIDSGNSGMHVDFPSGGFSRIENTGTISFSNLPNIGIFLISDMENDGVLQFEFCERSLLISNSGMLDNQGEIRINNSDFLGIFSEAMIINNGVVNINNSGIGILNSDTFVNGSSGRVIVNSAKTGIINDNEGTFANNGSITIDSSAVGIDNDDADFLNMTANAQIQISNIRPQLGRTDYFGIFNEGRFTNGRSSDILISMSEDSVTGIFNEFTREQFFKNEGDIFISDLEGVAINNASTFENFSFINIIDIDGRGIINTSSFTTTFSSMLDLPSVVFIDNTSVDAIQNIDGSINVGIDTKVQTGQGIMGSHLSDLLGATMSVSGTLLLGEPFGGL